MTGVQTCALPIYWQKWGVDGASMIGIGLTGSSSMVVDPEDTALAFRSGDVRVLATPRLLALMEEATCQAISPGLTAGETSVGASMELTHRRPTPVGWRVRATARVVDVVSSRVTFEVLAEHAQGQDESFEEVAVAMITRVVVQRDVFTGGLAQDG